MNVLLSPRTCNEKNFDSVRQSISDFNLDDRLIQSREFLIIAPHDEIYAFGRLRSYPDFCELSSVGVMPDKRGEGYGRRITDALCRLTELPVYIVTNIPEFFELLGFAPCSDYPVEIAENLFYCTSQLHVSERYCVMKRQVSSLSPLLYC
jgi:N-acetylglutamate synthase-like GNAT family acetyltransferase